MDGATQALGNATDVTDGGRAVPDLSVTNRFLSCLDALDPIGFVVAGLVQMGLTGQQGGLGQFHGIRIQTFSPADHDLALSADELDHMPADRGMIAQHPNAVGIVMGLVLIALWGAFSVIMVWKRVSQSRFRNEEEQAEFLDQLENSLSEGDVDGAVELCDGDPRAMPQLAMLAVSNREMGIPKMRAMLTDRSS